MGMLTVLGLQLCLLAFGIGAEISDQSLVSDTESQMEQNSQEVLLNLETGYGALHQAEAPELGLEMKFQAPQDYDIMLMKHRVRRSERKKKKKNRVGSYSPLGASVQQASSDGKKTPASYRTKREEKKQDNKLPQSSTKKHPGRFSPLGSNGETEVVRPKRQLENDRKRKKSGKKTPRPKQGTYSALGSQGPTKSSTQ